MISIDIIELFSIARIISNKIYHTVSSQGIYLYERVPFWKIVKAIKNKEDLNLLTSQKFSFDLNNYLLIIYAMRKKTIEDWISYFTSSKVDKEYLNVLGLFFSTHTDNENNMIKKAIIENFSEDGKDKMDLNVSFYTILLSIYEETGEIKLHF